MDCRGVHDALARPSSSCLGLKHKRSGLEALALKQSLVQCGTMGDVATRDSDTARAPWVVFGGKSHTTPNLNLRETMQNVDLTFWKNLTKTSLQPMVQEIQRMSR